MCDPISMFLGTGGGKLAKALFPKPPKPPKPPPPQQPARAPDIVGMRRDNAALASSRGPSSTWLTGAGGIDALSLNLGRNTFLGA